MARSATKQRIAQAQNGANHIGDKERRFFDALKNIFVGVPVEGESGYINLMHIKARYFEKVMEPHLRKEIDNALEHFPDFREELFDKLYTFFRRYFTESGSIGFFFTPYHQSVYEQVYTNEQDVVLFWKTARLYYVKTDRLFQSMTVEVDGFRFHFDVSQLEHKRANEKRELIYAYKERQQDGAIVFTVHYSERGRKTKIDDIRCAIRDALGLKQYTDAVPTEETLQKAFRIFERQSEVDYFLCKDAKSFLREQFDLWMWQYLLGKPGEKPQTEWTEIRLAQLQALKRIAYQVIDYIAAFEDELVKIWNKPKFVLNSHYVITLDRIAAQPGGMEMLERLWAHPNMETQLQEWRELGMVDDKFQKDHVWEHNLVDGKHLHPRYRYLPIDTKHFPDLELPMVALFDNLDEALDGWLIKSENYQALNTILPKFRGKVKCTYIDPPYNTKASEIAYINNYKHASWLSLLNNRIARLRELLTQDGILCVTIDETEYHRLYGLLLYVFRDEDAILGTVVIRSNPSGRSTLKGFAIAHEYAIFVSSGKNATIGRFARTEKQIARYQESDAYGRFEWVNFRKHGGANAERTARPKLFYPIYVSDKDEIRIPKMEWDASSRKWLILEHPRQNEEVVYPISSRGEERTWKWGHETARKKIAEICAKRDQTGKISIYLKSRMREEGTLPLTWWDKREYSATDYGTNFIGKLFGKTTIFSFPKSVYATADCLKVANLSEYDLCLDFFAGSGTTAHAVINLNREDGGRRKYILVEMADYFNTVLLPRVKKVVFSDKWKDGRALPEGTGISHFVKYYELEQFEDALRRTHYSEDDLFTPPAGEDLCQYLFMRDLKMLEALEVDLEQGAVQVDLSRLYGGIDLPETLSNLTGKWIRRIHPDPNNPRVPAVVEFADGERVDLNRLDWRRIKPLIWWS
jgi:adenine-specific DNA-methyltransferase